MITKYQQAAQDYIKQQKALSLTVYRNKADEAAQWHDYVWIATDPKSKKLSNFYFLNPNEVNLPHIANDYQGPHLLSGFAADLAKCYTIDLVVKQGLTKDTLRKQLFARKILSMLNDEIWTLTQDKLDAQMDNVHSVSGLSMYRAFIEYCHEMGFLAKTVRFNYKSTKDTSVEAAIKKQHEKMPDEQLILATASIFHDIVPHEKKKINVFDNVRDRFVSCMTTLALASPNRLVAEQIMLNQQALKSKQVMVEKQENGTVVKDIEGKPVMEEHTIHWLDWQGSKGYKDNRNHQLSSMAPFVERALDYLNVVCEPARVLCRYYSNPDATLKDILWTFKPKNLHGLSLDKPVNLFQLGGLLGFYEETNLSKLTLKGFPFTADLQQAFNWTVPNAMTLLGTRTNRERKYLPFQQEQKKITLAEVETLWLAHIKTSLPAFPYRHEGDSGSKVKLEHALCVFTGAQLTKGLNKTGNGQYDHSVASHFAIDSIDLGRMIKATLDVGGIFQRNGFADTFTIDPHQFRHYLNTILQGSEISEIIIAMFSGRTNVESNADYDGTPDSELVGQIARITRIHTQDLTQSVKVHTQEEYEKATGKVTHLMSTGMCVQQLHQTPCTFLNDFLTHCVGCRSSCHLNRDVEAIELLEQDLAIQKYRLDEVKNNPSIKTNPLRQAWFRTHHSNVFVLEELIKLMKSHDIKEGSLIRYAGDESAFHLIDIEKRERIAHKISLPDSQKALDALLLDLKGEDKPKAAQGLNDLLAKLGVAT